MIHAPAAATVLLTLAWSSTALILACSGGQTEAGPGKNGGERIALPTPRTAGSVSLEAALSRRRSVRSFQTKTPPFEALGQLAWAAQGVRDPAAGRRTAPSAGALYPLEIVLVTGAGSHRYDPETHAFVRMSTRDLRTDVARAALDQSAVRDAPVVFVIAGVISRTRVKYGDRADRYVAMEAGHAAQNLLLQAAADGLAAVPVGAFDDSALAKALGLPAGWSPFYVIPVGYEQP